MAIHTKGPSLKISGGRQCHVGSGNFTAGLEVWNTERQWGLVEINKACVPNHYVRLWFSCSFSHYPRYDQVCMYWHTVRTLFICGSDCTPKREGALYCLQLDLCVLLKLLVPCLWNYYVLQNENDCYTLLRLEGKHVDSISPSNVSHILQMEFNILCFPFLVTFLPSDPQHIVTFSPVLCGWEVPRIKWLRFPLGQRGREMVGV